VLNIGRNLAAYQFQKFGKIHSFSSLLQYNTTLLFPNIISFIF
jgi:hypothetical protein